jgi:CHAT domain-containing protein
MLPLLAAPTYSEETTGTIFGTLLDQTGGVLPGVKVLIKNVDTGLMREVATNKVGQYSVNLAVGNHEVSFFLPNFQPFTARGISLHVNDRLTVNGELKAGLVETLTVTAERLQPTSAVQTLIQPSAVRELPFLIRMSVELVSLVPGVSSDLREEKCFCVQGSLHRYSVDANLNAKLMEIASTIPGFVDSLEMIRSLLDRARGMAQNVARALPARVESARGRDSREVAIPYLSYRAAVEEKSQFAERAVAIKERELGPLHPNLATSLINLGLERALSGDPAAAKPLVEGALVIREAAFGPDHLLVAGALRNLVGLLIMLHEDDEAKAVLERARRIEEGVYGAASAELAANTGAAKEAFTAASRTEALNWDQVRLTVRTLPERQALAYASSVSSGLDLMLQLSSANPGDRQMSAAAWDAVIRTRGIVLDEMAARHRSASTSESKEIAALVEALASTRQRLADLYVRGVRDDSPERYRLLLEEAIQEEERAERNLAEKSAEFREDHSRNQIGLPDLVATLPAKRALVAFVRYRPFNLEPAYLAFVLRGGDSVPAVVPLGSAASVEGLILQWRKQLDQEALASGRGSQLGEAAYRRVAGELRQRVWDPLRPHLSNVTRVFVVPDGALHLVNIAALPTEASKYLVETGSLIHYLSTERDLVTTKDGRPVGEGLLALGGPSFDESGPAPVASEASFRGTRSTCGDFQSMRFDPLPAALNEVNDVVTLWNQARGPALPQSIRLTGAEATESAFKAGAIGRRILHLATHGFFLGGRCASALDSSATSMPAGASKITRENPLLLSGLILAGANHRDTAQPDREDGVLTAEEVAALNLSGVEWAVLSGCDTGVGEVRAGEGVFGLQRAFRMAGAKTVIMSLWPVQDKATHEWMTTLYSGRLKRKLGTAEAVREASLAVLRQRRAAGQNTHPFYWAGFVAVGDWR